MKITIDIGGSLLFKENNYDFNFISNLCNILKELKKENEICVVVGGGKLAKNAIRNVRKFFPNDSYLDMLGIDFTRVNARIISLMLGDESIKTIPKSLEECILIQNSEKIMVCGGFQPGQTTDAVSAIIAEFFNHDILIVASDVDGIYNKDPKKYRDAKLIKKIERKNLGSIITSMEAGISIPLDPVAVSIISRARYKVFFINGKKLGNIKNVIEGKNVNGTIIV